MGEEKVERGMLAYEIENDKDGENDEERKKSADRGRFYMNCEGWAKPLVD